MKKCDSLMFRAVSLFLALLMLSVSCLAGCSDKKATKQDVINAETNLETTEHLDDDELNFDDKTKDLLKKYCYEGVITAFLTKDIDACARFARVDAECIKDFSTVRFKKYSIYEKEDAVLSKTSLVFDFTVEESDFESLPVGDYSYTLGETAFAIFKDNNTPKLPSNNIKLCNFINILCNDFLPVVDGDENLTEEAYNISVYNAALYLKWEMYQDDKQPTEDLIMGIINDVFGIQDFVVPESAGYISEGLCYSEPSRERYIYEVTEITFNSGKYEIEAQFYADAMLLVPSHKVKYVIAETDSEYGYALEEIILINYGKYEPLEYVL